MHDWFRSLLLMSRTGLTKKWSSKESGSESRSTNTQLHWYRFSNPGLRSAVTTQNQRSTREMPSSNAPPRVTDTEAGRWIASYKVWLCWCIQPDQVDTRESMKVICQHSLSSTPATTTLICNYISYFHVSTDILTSDLHSVYVFQVVLHQERS